MKLPDFTEDAPLNALRQVMGASLGAYSSRVTHTRLTIQELESLMSGGIDVNSDEVRVLDDATIAYKDSRVLLYIRDVQVHASRDDRRSGLPKFHVSNCRTLQEMRAKNRWGRYVVATRSDGVFAINRILGGGRIASDVVALKVCQNCLDALSFDGFSGSMPVAKKTRIVNEFTIDRFFAMFPKSLFSILPNHDGDNAPLNDYPAAFAELAWKIKEASGWRCSNCSLVLSGDKRKFLHLHHKNGQKHDSGRENLEVLCLGCHASEPGHSHMTATPQYQIFTATFGLRTCG